MSKTNSLIMAARLKQLRKERKLSHVALSTALNQAYGIDISRDSLMSYEVTDPNHSKHYKNEGMRVEYLRCLADFYNVSSDYLLGLTNDPSKNPAAADELGLSAALIDKLKRYSKYDIINTLLETMFDTSIFISISALTNNINKVKDITIQENIILDYDNFEMPVSEQERKELSIAAILMREIFNAHPEFYGLYQITTASEHFHIQIDDICDIFRYCIEKVTGYSDYITRKR